MGNTSRWAFLADEYFIASQLLDREFDNDNDLPSYSVKSATPRDTPALSE